MSSSYFTDYFESYSPGSVTPAGMTIQGGSTILAAPAGIDGGQCWQTGFAWRDGSDSVSDVSIFQSLQRLSQRDQNANIFLQLLNAPDPFINGISPSQSMFTVRTENDGTLSFFAGNLQQFILGNTGAPNTGADSFVMSQNDWFNLQCNVSLSQVAIMSSANHNLKVDADIAIDGELLISNSVIATNVIIESLQTPLPTYNVPWWLGPGYNFDSMTYEALQPINTNPNPDLTRAARLSQLVNELMERPDNSAARASQLVNELMKLPSNSAARASQLVIELMLRTKRTGSWRVYEA